MLPLSGPESGFLRSCSLGKAPTTRKKDSRVEPQNRSGPHWALVAGFRALESVFLKGVVDLVDYDRPGSHRSTKSTTPLKKTLSRARKPATRAQWGPERSWGSEREWSRLSRLF